MANRRLDPVSYRPFRVEPTLAEGLLAVPRDGGDLERKVAMGMARLADEAGQKADRQAALAGAKAGARDALAGAPTADTISGGEVTGTVSANGQAGHVRGAQGGTRVYTGNASAQVKALLRHEEGFRETPYWDTNAWRIGYGSDTVTTVDGRSVRVTPGMKISREDAERDLDYRLTSREGAKVRSQLGTLWDGLAPNVQAALYSVGYNYGSLPDDVVDAVKTGSISDVASAVGGLGSNKERRGREAAMISSSFQTLPSASSVAPISVTPVREPVTITPGRAGTFRPTGRDTVYSRAYDVQGERTYLEMADAAMVENQSALFDAYGDDPAMLEKALGEGLIADLRDNVFEEIAPEYTVAYRKRASALMSKAHEAERERQAQQTRMQAIARIDALENRRSQLLAGYDPKDPNAASSLADTQAQIDANYDSAVARGVMDAETAQNAKRKSRSDMTVGFYVGQAKNLPADEIDKMYSDMVADYANGGIEGVTAEDWPKIEEGLSSAARTRRTQDENASKLLRQRGDELALRVARGLPMDAGELSRFQQDSGTVPDGRAILQSTLGRINVADAIRKRPIAEVRRNLDKLIAGPDGTVSPVDREYALDAIDRHIKDVTADPLGVAERFGLVPPVELLTLDGTKTADETAQGLQARIAGANAAALHFGVLPQYFHPEEVATVKSAAVSSDPETYKNAMQQLDVVAGQLGMPQIESDFGKDAADRLQDWQAKVRYSTPAEAAEWLKQRNDPQWQERVRPLVAKGQMEARKIDVEDVVAGLDENAFWDAGAPIDEGTRRAMMNDFVQLTGERFASTQDIGKAKDQALERMKKIWGVTGAYGDRAGRLMLYPPEEHYPQIAGSPDWIGQELAGIATARGADVENMALVADSKTKAAVDRGELPGYLISIVNPETGLDELMTDDQGRVVRHFFDPDAAIKAAGARAAEERRTKDDPLTGTGMTEQGKVEARRTRNDPWLVLGEGTSIGPFYPFGARPAELDARKRRIKEILSNGRGGPSALQAAEEYERENGPGPGAM